MRKSSLSEDTLLRQLVAALAETFARLAQLRTAASYQQALEIIDQNIEELLGLKADLTRQLDDHKIVEMLTNNDFLDIGRLYYVAEIFRQEGKIRSDMGQKVKALTCKARALNLFLEIGFTVENEFLEVDERIDNLYDEMDPDIPEDILFTTFDYYEQVGAFDRAERSIDLMLQATANNPDIMAEKRAFYTRLLVESDEELTEGGLSREEINRKLKII